MSQHQAPPFSEIYQVYRGKVVAYAAKLIGPDDAEDVAQEVFFKVSRSLGTLADGSRLAPWIFAITLNTVRDVVRRASRVPSGPPPAPAEGQPADMLSRFPDSRARTPEEDAVRKEMVSCYLKYLKQLPRDQYKIYVLSEFAELTDPEIARRLSLPLSTVKMRLHRARARLHAELRRHCQCYYNDRGELMGEPKESSRGTS